MKPALNQFAYLWYEIKLMNPTSLHWLNCWFRPTFWVIASYRFNRAGYLFWGRAWIILRILIAPLLFLIQPWVGQCDISYHTEIGRGLKILHPRLGIVISQHAIIGKNMTLVGGNCIGVKLVNRPEPIVIGDNVILGANAVIIGSINIGNNVQIGAGSVVVKNIPSNNIIGGVPAKLLGKTK